MKLIDILVEELPKNGGWLRDVKTMTQDRYGDIWGYDCVSPCLEGGFWSSKSGEDLVRTSKIEVRNLAVDWNTAIITREQYEAALAAKNEGWIEWGGGECPVDDGEVVDVMFGRGGRIISTNIADCWRWSHSGTDSDIISYRLHKPTKSERVRADAWNAYAGITMADDEADLNDCIGQDAAPVWNGEGLPPVGCECEFISNDTSWGSVVVIWMDGDKVVIKPSGETYYGITPSERQVFRPIRSEADRKRDEAVEAIDRYMPEFIPDTPNDYYNAKKIYDAIAAGKIPGVKLDN